MFTAAGKCYVWSMEGESSYPAMSGPGRMAQGVLIACGALFLVFGIWHHSRDSRILRVTQVPGSVISVVSGKGVDYYIPLDDDRTVVIPGPTLPLHPSGSAVTLERLDREDGTVSYRFPLE